MRAGLRADVRERGRDVNLNDGEKARRELDRAVTSGSAEAVARAAMSNVWPLFSAHFAALTEAIESLPAPVLERYPVLRALHRMTPVLARTTRPFKPLVYPDDARSMSPDELDILTLVQMIAFRFSGDVAAALIYARRLEDRILQVRVESRERTDGPLWYYHQQIGSTLLAAGDSGRALLEFATARQLGRLSTQPDAERMALGRTALAHAVRGSLDGAESALADLAHQPPATPAHAASTRATECTAAAILAVERLADEADGLLAALEPYDSIELTWPFALLARARALLAAQRPDDALEAIRLASDAHPTQHGSFASDVVTSTSIEALSATGELRIARRLADAHGANGILTSLAVIRLCLHEVDHDEAAHRLRLVTGDLALGPGQRTEAFLLSAWLELARTGDLAHDTSLHLSRIAVKGSAARLLATMPRQLIAHAARDLPSSQTAAFAAATAGLPHVEVQVRPALTRGELRVLGALAEHRTTAEIAMTFHVSPNTVKSQLKSLYRKLGCSTRDEAIKTGVRLNLLAPDRIGAVGGSVGRWTADARTR